ncbi:MAG: hypothetical protein Q8N15_04250, partial [Bacillota bacterium]|nr:hypothetical protein [Bacillota bacterium]
GMLKAILTWYHRAQAGIKENIAFPKLTSMEVLNRIGRMKYLTEDHFDVEAASIMAALESEYAKLLKGEDLDA